MPLFILSAVTGLATTVKCLYDFYALHQSNQILLDVLSGFSNNLQVTIERLNVREELLARKEGESNIALESIGKDFDQALIWLASNDRNLKSRWSAIQSAEKLKELDTRLTKSFASNMSIAILSSLHDSKEATYQIQDSLNGLSSNLESVVKEASRESLKEAISILREEAFSAKGGEGRDGFTTGEAEKIISQLVDQLSAQESLRDDEAASSQYIHNTPTARSSISTARTSIFSVSSKKDANSSGESDDSTQESDDDLTEVDQSERGIRVPRGSIIFEAVDPSTGASLVDPVFGDDGSIYDRFALINGQVMHSNGSTKPVIILGSASQLQTSIFDRYPDRIEECEARRVAFEKTTVEAHESSTFESLPLLVDSLSHVLLWNPFSVSSLLRRGIARFRLRDLQGALNDFDNAVEASLLNHEDKKGKGKAGEVIRAEVSIEALRMRAVIKEEIHDTEGAVEDIRAVLRRSPHDVLMLSLRASIRASAGDLNGAASDLAEANITIKDRLPYRSALMGSSEDLDFLSRGFAYLNILHYSGAERNFNIAISIRPDPYSLACRGLSRVNGNIQVEDGWIDLNEAIRSLKEFASNFATSSNLSTNLVRYSSGSTSPQINKESGLPTCAYGSFFLRGMAHFSARDFSKALLDLETAISLRPSIVREQAELYYVLAKVYAELGQKINARKNFDRAVAFCNDSQRFVYCSSRDSYGL